MLKVQITFEQYPVINLDIVKKTKQHKMLHCRRLP